VGTNLKSAAILAFMLYGCSGVQFVDSASNLPVPPGLAERTLWKDTAIVQYKLQSLTGYVLERPNDGDTWVRVTQVTPTPFALEPDPIADGEFYHSIVDSSIQGSAGVQVPILSVAANLKDTQRLEVTISDAALLHIPDNLIPWKELGDFVTKSPSKQGLRRVWVQAAMLTKMTFKMAHETDASSTVSGAAFKVDGKVFNQSETMQRQAFITMLLIDLNELERRTRHAGVGLEFEAALSDITEISRSSLRYREVESASVK
jgi:hypothetical protein